MKYVIVAFIIGCAVGYYVMPTKEVVSTEQSKRIAELEKQIKEKKDVVTYRTIYKDRIVERIVDRSVTDEISNETSSDIIDKKEITKINSKMYTAEIGYTARQIVYGHLTMPVMGNIFLGVHVASSIDMLKIDGGVGIGIRF